MLYLMNLKNFAGKRKRQTSQKLFQRTECMANSSKGKALSLMDYTHIVGELELHYMGYRVTQAMGGEQLQGLLRAFGPRMEDVLARRQEAREVVEAAGPVGHGEGQHVGELGDELPLPENEGAFFPVAGDDPGDAEVRGLGDGQGPHVDAVAGQEAGELVELPGPVL